MLLEDVIQRGTRAAQPAATAVATGTLYYVTDEGVTERSNATTWDDYSDAGDTVTRTVGIVIDGGGSVISTGIKGFVSVNFGGQITRARLLSIDASRGIANQGNFSSASVGARYWRYPEWRFNQLTVNTWAELGQSFTLTSTAWLQLFEQTIEQYTDDRYETVESAEDDTDRTLGTRIVGERSFADVDVRLFGNTQLTEHRQVDFDVLAGSRGPMQEFQQNIYSLGVEVDAMPRSDLQVSAGVAYDLASTPKTGGRPAQENLDAWAGNVAVRWFSGESWEVATTVGRRTRFPALRELYGEALGEFLLNPGLKPETATLADLTLARTWRDGESRLRVTPWFLRVDDTLSRRSVTVDAGACGRHSG